MHYTFPFVQKIELKHPLSSETLLSLQNDQGMAMNNYWGRERALKWPQIFIRSGAGRGERVSGPACINGDVSHSPVSLNRSIRSSAEARPVSGKDQQSAGQDRSLSREDGRQEHNQPQQHPHLKGKTQHLFNS